MEITKINLNGEEYQIKDTELTDRVENIESLIGWSDYE
jgi:hypothetical protein